MQKAMWAGGLVGALVLGCSEPIATEPGTGLQLSDQEVAGHRGVQDIVTGGGQFVHPDFGSVTFAFVAVRHRDGRVSGRFLQHQPFFGFVYAGDVTCFAVDEVNHRAWVGGVLTHSNDPDPITEVGDDAWFRVLDTGKSAEPDRSTFLGFEQPPPGIVTSEEYCQIKIWPDGNARTWPVERGNIVIH
jgi:hypothetical protein